MLMDRNWLTQRGAFANNGDFVLNVVEKMIGGNILSDLRGKGTSWRPFEKIISLEKIAEQKFQLQEQMLQPQGGSKRNPNSKIITYLSCILCSDSLVCVCVGVPFGAIVSSQESVSVHV